MNQSFGTGGSQGGNLLGLPTPARSQPNPRANLVGNVENITPSYGITPSSNMAPVKTQDMQMGSVMGQQPQKQGILGNINQFMMNPSTAMAIGLLQPTKGGSIGEALGGGYQNLMAQNLMNQKLKQQQFANLLGVGGLMAQLGKPSNIQYMVDEQGNTVPVGVVGNKIVNVSTGKPTDVSKLKLAKNPLVNIGQETSPLLKEAITAKQDLKDAFGAVGGITQTIGTTNDMLSAINNDEIFTTTTGGIQMFATDFVTGLNSLGNFFGVPNLLTPEFANKSNQDKSAATKVFFNQIASQALASAKKLKGQGSITDPERQMLATATTANPFEMDNDSLKQVLANIKKVQFAELFERELELMDSDYSAFQRGAENIQTAKRLFERSKRTFRDSIPDDLFEEYLYFKRSRLRNKDGSLKGIFQ